MPRSAKSVSEKNTKNEILAAYQELLVEVSGSATPSLEYQEEKSVVAAASGQTVEKITSELSKLKLSFAAAVNDLTDRLTQEAETLATIQKAIAIAKKELEETQKIKVTAGFLYRLLETQKEKEQAFEKDMAEKRKAWAAEEKAHEEEMSKQRTRDEEEYGYEMKLLKQRDADERESVKLARERKEEEEASVKAALYKELEELRKKVVQAPTDTEKTVKEAVARALVEAKRDADVVMTQIKFQAESDLRVAELKIESLEALGKSQTNDIVQLKKQLDEATRQVKDIAVSVIENTRKESTSTPSPQDK